MRLLLDTNAFLWASREPHLLSTEAKRAIEDPLNERFVSLASIWEMQIKHGLGKLDLPDRAEVIAVNWTKPLVASLLPIELRHFSKLYELPPHHRDPFDRLLVAQAIAEKMTIVTPDAAFSAYSGPVIW